MADPIRDYRDLVAWQRAMELALVVDVVCEKMPQHAWKQAAQMRESAKSVYRNIAEGNGRFTTADYLRAWASRTAHSMNWRVISRSCRRDIRRYRKRTTRWRLRPKRVSRCGG